MALTNFLAAGLSFSSLLSRIPGGISQGLIWGIMAVGVFITFRILDIADLSVDGTFATGGAVTVMLIINGVPAALACICATLAGIICGFVCGLLHSKLNIPAILSGILIQFALYSVNLRIMGGSANKSANPDSFHLFISLRNVPMAILCGFIFAACLIAVLYWYFGTEQGSAMRATGSNPAMSRAMGVNIGNMKIIGLAISNGIVALSGSLMAQYQGYADVSMGRGAIVIGLAAVIIGEVLCDAIFKKGTSFVVRLCFIVLGGVIYYLVMVIILWLKLDANDLKLFTALIVAIFLAVPYLKDLSRHSFKSAYKRSLSFKKEGK